MSTAAEPAVLMRVFTHPACSGCPEAVQQAWKLARSRPGIELRTVSLEHSEGLSEARAERVSTIPTVIVSTADRELARWAGAPDPGALQEVLDGAAAPPA